MKVGSNFELDTEWADVEIDFDPTSEIGLVHRALVARLDAEREVRNIRQQLEREAEHARKERNKPVIGKTMKVIRGRKVPKGYIGVVAWISAKTGGVLLKDPQCWQDRTVQGVWVSPEYLEGV